MIKRKIILYVITLFFITSFCFGQKWGLFYSSPINVTKDIKAINAKTGMIPVGISYYNKKLYLLFNDGKQVGASAYYIQVLKGRSSLQIQRAIQLVVKRGWIPFDITDTQREVIILYLKCKVKIDEWKIVRSKKDWTSIQNTVTSYRSFFPLGISFSAIDAHILLIRSNASNLQGWMIRNVGGTNIAVKAAVKVMMAKGYMPYGFEYRGGQVGIVFLK